MTQRKKILAKRFGECVPALLKRILTSADSSEVILSLQKIQTSDLPVQKKCLTFADTSDLDVSAKTENRSENLTFFP